MISLEEQPTVFNEVVGIVLDNKTLYYYPYNDSTKGIKCCRTSANNIDVLKICDTIKAVKKYGVKSTESIVVSLLEEVSEVALGLV